MPKVSIRRRSARSRKALTAAAQAITDASAFKKSVSAPGRGEDWQEDAWNYTRHVGELDYYLRWRAHSVSRCRLVASEVDETGQPTGRLPESDTGQLTPEAQRVQDIVIGIGGSASGRTKMLRRLTYILSVPGESWVAMLVRDPAREEDTSGSLVRIPVAPLEQTEQWFVFDRAEIKTQGDDIVLMMPDGMKHTYDPATDLLFRVWDESPRNARLATSPIQSNLDTLNEIVRTTATIDNASKSRLTGNGMLLLPAEASLPTQAAPMPMPTAADPAPPDPVPPIVGAHASAQDLQDMLFDVATAAMKDPNSLAANLPIVITVPGEQSKNFQWVRASSDIPETALKTRESAIRRLAMGLDVSPERLLGVGSSTNHWAAWNIDETDVRIHVAPMVEMICDAFTSMVLRPKLVDEGIDPDAYAVWYDTTDLAQDPDKRDEAKDAYDRGAINSGALREYFGLDPDSGYDLETADGWLSMMLDRIATDPTTLPVFQPMLQQLMTGKLSGLVPPPAPAIAPPPEQPPAEQAPAPTSEPDQGPQPAQTAAVQVMARFCVTRALELANKRRRTRANSDTFRDIPIELAHTKLPGVPRDQAYDLIKGWDVGLTDTDIEEIGAVPHEFRDTVRTIAARCLISSSPVAFPPSAFMRR